MAVGLSDSQEPFPAYPPSPTYSGGWSGSTLPAGETGTATWTVSDLPAGHKYQVLANWAAGRSTSPASASTFYDGTSSTPCGR